MWSTLRSEKNVVDGPSTCNMRHSGNANQLYTANNPCFNALHHFPNLGTDAPEAGDIITWIPNGNCGANDTTCKYGHTAIIRDVVRDGTGKVTRITIIQQNVKQNTCDGAADLNVSVDSGGHYAVDSIGNKFTTQGWMGLRGSCTPNCTNKCDGASNGCDGFCNGSCGNDQVCSDQACVACGGNGEACCSGNQCESGLACSDGFCGCTPNCTDKCGGASNGCGGTCNGSCGNGQVCSNQSCVACGGDGQTCCGGNSCESGLQCSGGVCGCTPSCTGKCDGASNGCGGFCNGSCNSGQVCSSQSCVACGDVGQACCSGNTCNSSNVCQNGTCQAGCTTPYTQGFEDTSLFNDSTKGSQTFTDGTQFYDSGGNSHLGFGSSHGGSYAMNVYTTNSGAAGNTTLAFPVSASASQTVQISFWIYNAFTSSFTINALRSGGATVPLTVPAQTWTQLSATLSSGSATSTAVLQLGLVPNGNGGWAFHLDDVQIQVCP
jgi:hypothetical protein